ncbi:MAG TPA: cytochrome P450 [Steroidobacteraceae bacterium]|nr:cytochrome P450 [Steroidobacteraceae bacterium]
MNERRHPPGPASVYRAACTVLMRHAPMQFLTRIAIRYGGIARIPLAHGFLFLVSGPELIRELLVDHRTRFVKNTRYSVMQKVLGQGLLLSEGEVWRRQRLAAQPSFKPGALERQVSWMSPLIADYLDDWDARKNGDAIVDISAEFSRLAQALAGRLLFGSVFARHAATIVSITQSMGKFWPSVPRFLHWQSRKHKATKALHLAQALADLDAEIYALMDASQAAAEPCMLATLRADAAEGAERFTPAELCDQMKTLFFAGYETTATSMVWTHYLLARHPAVRARMTAEIDRIVSGRTLTEEQLDALPYLEQVFKESLRLYSPIHSLSRVALEECAVGDYIVPKGATVMVSLYASHRLPQNWPRPRCFDPERFAADQSAGRHRFAYLPFAAGHRNCIGATLAIVEAKLIIAQVARRFHLILMTRGPVRPRAGTTMHPARALRMRIEPRAAR